jgi:hypothetical protein
MRLHREAVVLAVALLLLPLPSAGSALEVGWCTFPRDGVRDHEPDCAGVCGGGLDLSLRVGDESLMEFQLGVRVAGQSADALKDIAREAGRILKVWTDDYDDGEPHMKGHPDVDSRRSP